MSFSGKILYKLYHHPVQVVRSTLKTGIKETAQINAGKKQMVKASLMLKEVTYGDAVAYRVYFLTGKKYWFQTAFCLYSLQLSAGVNIHATIVDDGSFDDDLEKRVIQQFPSTATVIRTDALDKLLNEKLPEQKFSVLRQRRIVYPHIRKLTDIHVLPGDEPKLVLDSDMLFFKQPEELLDWLTNPSRLLFMRDAKESYGYSHSLMKELTGTHQIPERLNVGVAGMPSSKINWQQLEFWTDEMLKREGSSYLQEQALTAMLAASERPLFLNEESYKVLPHITSNKIPEVLHHYVASAKYDYFVKGWKWFT